MYRQALGVVTDVEYVVLTPSVEPPPNGNGEPPLPPPTKFPWVLPASLISGLFLFVLGSKT